MVPEAAGQGVAVQGVAVQGVAAQEVVAQAFAVDDDERRLELRLRAGGGADGLGSPNVHGWGGLEALLLRDWVGIGLRSEAGTGAGFRSILLAGGIVADVLEVGPVRLEAHAGGAHYREQQVSSGAWRHQTGPRLGLALATTLGPGRVVVDGSTWRGTLRGDGIVVDESRWTRRFMVGYEMSFRPGGGR